MKHFFPLFLLLSVFLFLIACSKENDDSLVGTVWVWYEDATDTSHYPYVDKLFFKDKNNLVLSGSSDGGKTWDVYYEFNYTFDGTYGKVHFVYESDSWYGDFVLLSPTVLSWYKDGFEDEHDHREFIKQ